MSFYYIVINLNKKFNYILCILLFSLLPMNNTLLAEGEYLQNFRLKTVSQDNTQIIVNKFTSLQKQCDRLKNNSYKLDCLSYIFWKMSKEIPRNSGYEDARLAFVYGASKFKELAKKNANFALKPLSVPNFSRKLNGITDDKINKKIVQEEIDNIFVEIDTMLLRSLDGSGSRKLAFQQIASIVASSKVLIRSE